MVKLVSCLNPKKVWNKYIGDYEIVPCRECVACKAVHASEWSRRLEFEASNSMYCFFVTLTYDDSHMHKCFWDKQKLYMFPEEEVNVFEGHNGLDSRCVITDDSTLDYIDRVQSERGWLCCPSVRDIQLFHKSLRNKFSYDYGVEREAFRFFLVSEYGPTTFRYHLHGLYFSDSPQVGKNFIKVLSQSWEHGTFTCEPVLSSASSYVSSYLTCNTDLPEVYLHPKLRPRLFCSKKPFLGAKAFPAEEVREILVKGLTKVRMFSKSSGKYVDVPLPYSVRNRLFPICRGYSRLSDDERMRLYTIAQRPLAEVLERVKYVTDNSVFDFPVSLGKRSRYSIMDDDLPFLGELDKIGLRPDGFDKDTLSCRMRQVNLHHNNSLYDLPSELVPFAFSYKETHNLDSLKRAWYLSRNFMANAVEFGLSYREYYEKIRDYVDRNNLRRLIDFLNRQSTYYALYPHQDPLVLYDVSKADNNEEVIAFNLRPQKFSLKDNFDYIEVESLCDKIINDHKRKRRKSDYVDQHPELDYLYYTKPKILKPVK